MTRKVFHVSVKEVLGENKKNLWFFQSDQRCKGPTGDILFVLVA